MTQRLDRFDLVAEVATGSLATIFLARRAEGPAGGGLVTIKRLRPHPAARRRHFLEVARHAAALHHANVVPVEEVGHNRDGDYLVMQYVEGDTLAHLLARSVKRSIPVPLQVTVRIFLDALAGLHAVHELPGGLVHGGLSPHDLMVGVDGVTRLADFGVEHAASGTGSHGSRPGKLAYLAPEQLGGQPIDRRADLFAIATMLWECITHRRLFKGQGDADTIEKVLHGRIPRLDEVRREVPAAIAKVCERALERDVTWRFGSAAELADALERAAYECDRLGTAREVAEHLDAVIGADIVRQRDELSALLARGAPVRRLASGSHLLQAEPLAETELAAPAADRAPLTAGVDDEDSADRAPTVSIEPPTVTGRKVRGGESETAPAPAPEPVPVLEPEPERFGKYEVIGHLADGGMAEVYLARASGIEGFEKIVVIKRLKPELAANATATRLFLQEARIAATLEHPQIAQVYDVGVVDGSYFFAMEHVYGCDLRKVMNAAIKRKQPVRLEDALRVITELAGALDYAHDKRGPDGAPLGLVHRDVSPSNVLISFDGAVKLCDFGVAEVTAVRDEPGQRVLAGKLSYMSPEQCRGDELDRRSDIFVLAIVLYELTTLTKVFKGKSERDVVQQIVQGQVRPPSALRPDYPPELERIVMKGLGLEREDRYATAQEMRADLEAFGREHKLALSAAGLSRLMTHLFAPDVAAWHAAIREGRVDELLTRELETTTGTPGDFDAGVIGATRAPRRFYRGFAAAAAAAAIAAAVTVPIEGARRAAARELDAQVQASGQRIAARLVAQIRAAHTRADAIAATPMLRAAIETDPTTMQDMVGREAIFAPTAGEAIEIFQWRGDRAIEMLRAPRAAAGHAPARGGVTVVAVDHAGLSVTVSARLTPLYQNNALDGALVITMPIDRAVLVAELPHGLTGATLRGLGHDLALVPPGAVAARHLEVALPLDRDWALPAVSLAVALPPDRTDGLAAARLAAIAGALACAGLYLLGRRRHRWWRKRPRQGAGT